MTEMPHCPSCGKEIPADAPVDGLCPRCLLKEGFSTESPTQTGGDGYGRPAPPAPEQLRPLFPNLEILELVGRGGMGTVYKARQPKLDRLVALKILDTEVARGAAFSERFTREARTLAKVSHPNIVSIHDFGEVEGLHYFVMEFVDGANLREVMQEGRLSPEEALAVIPQICDALQFAHEEGVVHRDIKPENILLDRKGRLKIADFGLAKMLEPGRRGSTLTMTGQVMGTPAYMAPEQIEKPTLVDHRADIYSLGVVFYEMLTGELPLGRFQAPSKKVSIDVRLDDVVLRTLEKEPELRYQQVRDVKTDVESLGGDAAPREAEKAKSAVAEPFVAGVVIGAGGEKKKKKKKKEPEEQPPPGTPGYKTIEIRRPTGVTLIALYCILAVGLAVLTAPLVGTNLPFFVSGPFDNPFVRQAKSMLALYPRDLFDTPIVALGFFAWAIAAGIGLLRLRKWSRISAIVLAILGLASLGIGTIVSIFILFYLVNKDVARLFELGEGAATVPEQEARRLEKRFRCCGVSR